MKKNEVILNLLGELFLAKGNKLSINRAKEILPEARSSYFRNLKELTEFVMPNGELLLKRGIEGEQEYLYLNKSFTKYFIPEEEDNVFLLGNLIKLGFLFDNSLMKDTHQELKEIFNINGRGKELNQKFHVLTKLEAMSDLDHYSEILTALVKNNTISFRYNEKSYESFCPICLCQYRDALYLIAYKGEYKEESLRKFKLIRFNDIRVEDQKFKYPSNWNAAKYFKNTSGIISGEEQKALIRVFRESRKHVEEKSFFNKEFIIKTKEYDEYQITFTSVEEVLGQLFVYAQDVEVLGPGNLREAFVTKAEKALYLNKAK